MLGETLYVACISCLDWLTLRKSEGDEVNVAHCNFDTQLSDLQFQHVFVSLLGSFCYHTVKPQ